MVDQYGAASVYGSDGVVLLAGSAVACFPESVEAEDRAAVDEFMSGVGEWIGSWIHDRRLILDMLLVPRVDPVGSTPAAVDDAIKALKFPATILAKVTFTPATKVVDSSTFDLYGAAGVAQDYIYAGGARRTHVRGQAGLRMTVMKSLTSPLTTAQLLLKVT